MCACVGGMYACVGGYVCVCRWVNARLVGAARRACLPSNQFLWAV